jgi:beta-galactosidase
MRLLRHRWEMVQLMRILRMSVLAAALSCIPVHARAAQVLLYCPYDGATDAAYSATGSGAASDAAHDVLLLLKKRHFEDGIVGQACLFDTGGAAYEAEGSFNESRGTLSMFVRPTWDGTNTTDYCTLFGLPKWGLLYKYTDQTILTFGWIKEDGFYDYGCTAPIDHWRAGEWHHVAISWNVDDARRRLYLDGQLAREGAIPSTHPGESPLTIGSSPGFISPARALVDEVYVWDDELLPEEIAEAVARARGGQPCWPVAGATGGKEGGLRPPAPGPRPALPDAVDWDLTHAQRRTTTSRERVALNGYWRFQPVGPSREANADRWHYLRVPGNWAGREFTVRSQAWEPISRWDGEAIASAQLAWYEREFTAPTDWRGRRVTLGIDSVRGVGEAFLNGEHLGRVLEYHTWRAQVLPHLRLGETNALQVLVRVLSPNANARGIDQDVWIEAGPPEDHPAIGGALLRTSVRDKRLDASVRIDRSDDSDFAGRLEVAVIDGDGQQVRAASAPVTAGDAASRSVAVGLPWDDARCWSPEDPYLYTATVRLRDSEGALVDEAFPVRFGFRELEIRGGDFYLNGHKTHLKGQAAPPFQQYAFCASEELIREWFRQLKSVGCHAVREYTGNWQSGQSCVWRDRYYDIADEMGMIIFAHVPGAGALIREIDDPEIGAGLRSRIECFVERYGNHACLAMWFQHFNTGSHVNDINPAWLDGSFDPADAPPDLQSAIKQDLALRHEAMRRAEEMLHEADFQQRPIFHHAAGNFGQVLTVMAYLNFDIPLQEREEWPSAWAARKPKPLMPVETGFPCILSWYKARERILGLQDVYSSEPLFTEYAAAYLGDAAYGNVTLDEIQAMGWPDKLPNLEAMKLTSANYDRIKELFGEWTVRSWRALDLSGYCEHVEYRDCFRYESAEEPLDLSGPLEFGLGLDNPPTGVRRATELTRLGEAMQRSNMPFLAFIGGEASREPGVVPPLSSDYPSSPEGVTGKEHAFFAGEQVRKSIVLVNDGFGARQVRGEWSVRDGERTVAGSRFSARVEPGGVQHIPIAFTAPDAQGERRRMFVALSVRLDHGAGSIEDRLPIDIWPPPELPDLSGTTIATLNVPDWPWLEKAGAQVVALERHPDFRLDRANLLIVGEGTSARELELLAEQPVMSAIQSGTNLLQLAQHRSALVGMPISYRRTRRCFIRDAHHPVLTGLADHDLFHWRGKPGAAVRLAAAAHAERDPGKWPEEFWPWSSQGVVATHVLEKPQAGPFRTLIDCEFDHLYAALLECGIGRGTVMFCQLDIEDRYGSDPVPTLLLHRMVAYLARAQRDPRPAYATSSEARSLLDDLGFVCQDVASTDNIDKSAVFVSTRISPEALALCRRGSTALLVGPIAPDEGELAPGVAVTEASTYALKLDGLPPEWAGIGPSDLFFKWPREVSVVEGDVGWHSEPGVLARIPVGDGRLFVCTVRPGDFALPGDAVRRAKVRRVISTLLTNLHVEAQLPRAPGATGPGSPFPEPALGYNPYLYRRW